MTIYFSRIAHKHCQYALNKSEISNFSANNLTWFYSYILLCTSIEQEEGIYDKCLNVP